VQRGIQQVVAADVVLWDVSDNRMFFKSFHDINEPYCTDSEYQSLYSIVSDEHYRGDNYICSSDYGFEFFQDSSGFLLFTYGAPSVDYYSGDVFYGTLYITEQNFTRGGEGIIVYDNSILGDLGNVYYDPVVN